MNNVHPIFKPALARIAPPVAQLRPYAVTFWINGQQETVNVTAFTTCDAIITAIDKHFDGEEAMPAGGLEIKADPIDCMPVAA